MTVAEYYAAHVDDGRAFFRNGALWIIRARSFDGAATTYWLCGTNYEGIELVDPLMDMRFLKRRRVEQTSEWHHAMEKSVRYARSA